MVDLGDPGAQPMLAAARAMDAVLRCAREMSTASRADRHRLLERILPTFAELRRLSREHFASRARIPASIDALYDAINQLVEMPGLPDSGPPAEHECPACHSPLLRKDRYGNPTTEKPHIIYCGPCVGIVMPPLFSLTSIDEGFSIEAL
ncbi:hypothetical protein [Singulisphaera sp. PoT]|uniref:hypothetical protein n=1 Tax=Singulisphaera sp. PoT TaxID=3411797 RepID=UPI003BF50500